MRRSTGINKGGFSLLELVLTLAIVAVMTAIAVPRYGMAAGRYRLDVTARRVAADLRLAQSYARTTSSPRTVVFDAAREEYRLLNVPALDGAPGDYTVALSGGPYQAGIVTADFGGVPQVLFNGWGLPSAGGMVTLAVGDRQQTVVVDAETGQVSIP